jgi:hypothetical protein
VRAPLLCDRLATRRAQAHRASTGGGGSVKRRADGEEVVAPPPSEDDHDFNFECTPLPYHPHAHPVTLARIAWLGGGAEVHSRTRSHRLRHVVGYTARWWGSMRLSRVCLHCAAGLARIAPPSWCSLETAEVAVAGCRQRPHGGHSDPIVGHMHRTRLRGRCAGHVQLHGALQGFRSEQRQY